jgi:hypothetical protein
MDGVGSAMELASQNRGGVAEAPTTALSARSEDAADAHPDPDPTYFLVPARRRDFAGNKSEQWPIVERIDDPRLGLTLAQLTASFQGTPALWLPGFGFPPPGGDEARPAGRGEDPRRDSSMRALDNQGSALTEETVAQLQLAVWALASRLVGETHGLRVALKSALDDFFQLATVSGPNVPGPFQAAARQLAAVRGQSGVSVGFGSPRASFRRGLAVGPFQDVHGSRYAPRWVLDNIDDGTPIDEAWARALTAQHPDGTPAPPLLDLRLLSCLFPARRAYRFAPKGRAPERLEMPAMFEVLAFLIALGDTYGAQRALLWLTERHTHVARNTLEGECSRYNGLTLALQRVGNAVPVLAGWQRPQRVELPAALKRGAKPPKPRYAPTLGHYRAMQEHWRKRLARARQVRDHSKPFADSDEQTTLKASLLLALGGDTGGRVNEFASLRLRDVEPAHRFGELVAPAIFVLPSKGVDIAPYWRALHLTSYELLAAWLADWGISDPNAPVFPSGRDEMDVPAAPGTLGTFFTSSKVLPLEAAEGVHGIHDLRHLAEQIGFGVGMAWGLAHPADLQKADPQSFADAFVGHAFGQQRHNYRDLERNRELWGARCGLGDPGRGVAGALDYLHGDAGARKRWDDGAIRGALSLRVAAGDAAAAAEYEIGQAAREITRHEKQLRRLPAISDIELHDAGRSLVLIQQRLAEMAERDQLRDQLDAAKEARHRAEQALAAGQAQVQQAGDALALLKAGGRTTVIADDAVVSDGELDESFEQAVERVADNLPGLGMAELRPPDSVADDVLLRCRSLLNLREWAALFGTTERTVARWVASGGGPIDVRSGLVLAGPRRRFIEVNRLDDLEARLTLAQRQQLEQMLRVEMGATRWGGPRMPVPAVSASS